MILHGGDSTVFDFPQNQWLNLSHEIDLDRDLIEFFLNEESLSNWTFSETVETQYGNNKLYSIVFNDAIDTLSQVHYFIDDYTLTLIPNSNLGEVELPIRLDLVLYPNPAKGIVNVSSGANVRELCTVKLFNTMGQLVNSKVWNPKDSSNLQFNIEGFPQGLYIIRVQSTNSVEVLKFIVTK